MHAFETNFFARMKSIFMESTHSVQIHIEVNFNTLGDEFPDGDILLFACQHPLTVDGSSKTQTIISSKICSASDSVFLFLPRGKYWVYWIEIEENADAEKVYESYTKVYKNPETPTQIGVFETS